VNDDYEPAVIDDLPTPLPELPADKKPEVVPETPSSTVVPNTCDTTYDAISVIRRGIYVFRGKVNTVKTLEFSV